MKKPATAKALNLIGPRVREARLRCKPGVSQDALAGRLAARGVSMDNTAISRIESGTRTVTDHELVAIADVLQVSVLWLLGLKR